MIEFNPAVNVGEIEFSTSHWQGGAG